MIMKELLAAHLDMYSMDLPVKERIARLKSLGFNAVELWCWWDYELVELLAALEKYNMILAAVCTRFVSLTDETCRDDYLAGLKETVEVCQMLKCKRIISQVGDDIPTFSRNIQKASVITGLKAAVPILENIGITLVIEPLNVLIDHCGYFLSHSDEAAEILQEVDSPCVKLLFDVYHQQISEGNLINNIKKHFAITGHYHIADNPGRNQPGTGEINYQNIFKVLEKLGNNNFLGLEFSISGDENEVLRSLSKGFED